MACCLKCSLLISSVWTGLVYERCGMKFKTGELLYPALSYHVVGRCPHREKDARSYQYVLGGVGGGVH